MVFSFIHGDLGFAQMWWRRENDGGRGVGVCVFEAHVLDLTTMGVKQH